MEKFVLKSCWRIKCGQFRKNKTPVYEILLVKTGGICSGDWIRTNDLRVMSGPPRDLTGSNSY